MAAMAEQLAHRGPDDAREVVFARAGLALRRLTLLDDMHGTQPTCDEAERYWSVFNGEIYNHDELGSRLRARGHRLRGHGDSELVPHLYEEYGPAFVEELRGMFAIAVYDRARHSLMLARDMFGIKPLYLADTGEAVLFGSEPQALFAAGSGSWPVSPEAVWHYLSYGYVPDPLTMWQGVERVPPGHYLQIVDGQTYVHHYATVRFEPVDQPLETSRRAITEAVEDSVAAHLTADVPVGAYLSSGVDSTYLAALAVRHAPLSTFSVGFEGAQGQHGETTAAAATAQRLGTRHHEEIISGQVYADALPQVVAAQDEPLADPSAPALWFLARLAASEVKAVLSGEGADELFAGYPIYRQSPLLRSLARLPQPANNSLARLAERLPTGMKGRGLLIRATTPLQQRFLGNAPVFDPATKRDLLGDAWPAGHYPVPSPELCARTWRDVADDDDVVAMQTVSCRTWLPGSILAKADRMAMAHSLEVRVPFLDRAVLAAASAVPVDQRVHRRATKVALRAAAAQAIPRRTADRPKLGFPVPFRHWLDGPLRSLTLDLLGNSDSLLRQPAVERVLDDRHSPGGDRRRWALLVYLLWEHQQRPALRSERNAATTPVR